MPSNPARPDSATTLVALPGRLFFCETVACPATLTAQQAVDLAHLTVESRSPFPEEKLSVCHRHDKRAGKLTAFAALKDRLSVFLPQNDAPVAHAVPDAALPLPEGEDGWRWIVTGNAMTAVRCEQGAPVAVRGFSKPESDDDSEILSARGLHAKRAGIPATGPLWRLTGAEPSRNPAGLRLHWRAIGKDSTHTSFAASDDLDVADVRPASVVAGLRRSAVNDRRLTLAFRGLGVAAILLALAQVSVWSLHTVAAHRETAMENNRSQAEAAEGKAALLDTLGKVTDRRTPQLEWMAALNAVRPDSVWLRRIAVDDKGVTASGNARSMESLNGWLSALRKSKDFTEVTAPRITTAGQIVSFDLRMTSVKPRIQNKGTVR